jgi:hypothetical protein
MHLMVPVAGILFARDVLEIARARMQREKKMLTNGTSF